MKSIRFKSKLRYAIHPSFLMLKRLFKAGAFRGPERGVVFPSFEKIRRGARPTDVILFSDGPLQILKLLGLKPGHKFRIWTLNKDVKSKLVRLYRIPGDKIGVLNRPEVPQDMAVRSGPILISSEPHSFLISSRPYKLKNVPIAVKLVEVLRRMTGQSHSVHLCGPGFAKVDLIKIKMTRAQKDFVKFHGDLGINWTKKFRIVDNPIYVNLSEDPLEDFSVSCFQAQLEGWPIITLNSGPFMEIFNYPQERLPKKYPYMNLIAQRKIIKKFLSKHKWDGYKPGTHKEKRPQKISIDELSSLISKSIKNV